MMPATMRPMAVLVAGRFVSVKSSTRLDAAFQFGTLATPESITADAYAGACQPGRLGSELAGPQQRLADRLVVDRSSRTAPRNSRRAGRWLSPRTRPCRAPAGTFQRGTGGQPRWRSAGCAAPPPVPQPRLLAVRMTEVGRTHRPAASFCLRSSDSGTRRPWADRSVIQDRGRLPAQVTPDRGGQRPEATATEHPLGTAGSNGGQLAVPDAVVDRAARDAEQLRSVVRARRCGLSGGC
jgi:hypothetical protein